MLDSIKNYLENAINKVYGIISEFTHECIKKILSLYKGAASPPKSVVLVGHSMVSAAVININIVLICADFFSP